MSAEQKLHLFVYRCANCGLEFKAPVVVNPEYLGLRSLDSGQLAVLTKYPEDPADAAVLDEVRAILKDLPILQGQSGQRLASAGQAAYSVVFDPAEDGSRFVVGAGPRCPGCGSDRMAGYEATEPPEFVTATVPDVTHREWDTLPADEKRERINRAVVDHLSG